MAKIVEFKKDAKKKIQEGVTTLAKAVKVTMGPKGRNVIISERGRSPHCTKDGVTVAKAVVLKDPFANMGATLLKDAAQRTAHKAGDGTTTAIVLADSIFQEGMKRLVAGVDPIQMKKGLDEGLKVVIAALDKMATPVAVGEDVEKVATLAANHDKEVGKMIREAIDQVGKEGSITVEQGESKETRIKLTQGLTFEKGYLSPYFINSAEKMHCEMEDVLLFLTDKKLSSAYDVVPILELLVENDSKGPLLLIAEDIDAEALQTLVVNRLKGGLELCAVKSPFFGEQKKEVLQDIAVLSGATALTEESGFTLESLSFGHFGKLKKIKIDKEETTLLGGHAEEGDVLQRVKEIKRSIENAKSDYEREKLEKRLSSLTGGMAVIQVGAATESEMKEKKDRVEDALHAAKAALKEGIVPGGGVALLRASLDLDNLSLSGDRQVGAELLKNSLTYPVKTIAENAGFSGEVAIERILREKGDFGFNALTSTFGPLLSQGIIDPVLVTKEALKSAVSIASMLLTVDVMIAEKPEDPKKKGVPSMDMGGMPGMGGMGMGGMGGFPGMM